MATFRKQ